MVDMVRRSIFPVATSYAARLAAEAASIAAAGAPAAPQEILCRKISGLLQSLSEKLERLDSALASAQAVEEPLALAKAYRESVVPKMDELRDVTDSLERLVDAKLWPFPTYQELLFSL